MNSLPLNRQFSSVENLRLKTESLQIFFCNFTYVCENRTRLLETQVMNYENCLQLQVNRQHICIQSSFHYVHVLAGRSAYNGKLQKGCEMIKHKVAVKNFFPLKFLPCLYSLLIAPEEGCLLEGRAIAPTPHPSKKDSTGCLTLK